MGKIQEPEPDAPPELSGQFQFRRNGLTYTAAISTTMKKDRSWDTNTHKKKLLSYHSGAEKRSLQVWIEDGAYKDSKGRDVDRRGKVMIGTGFGYYALRPEQITALVKALQEGKKIAQSQMTEIQI